MEQGAAVTTSSEAVLWIQRPEERQDGKTKIIAYFEGNVEQNRKNASAQRSTWFGRFETRREAVVRAGQVAGEPTPPSAGLSTRHGMSPALESGRFEAERTTAGAIYAAEHAFGGTHDAGRFFVPLGRIRQSEFSADCIARNHVGKHRDVRSSPHPHLSAERRPGPNGFHSRSDRNANHYGHQFRRERDRGQHRQIRHGRTLGGPYHYLDGGARRRLKSRRTAMSFRKTMPRSRSNSTWKGTSFSAMKNATIYAERMYYDVPNEVGTIVNAEMLTPRPAIRRTRPPEIESHSADGQRTLLCP